MLSKPSKVNIFLLLGILGIIGAVVTVISDFILIGRPTDTYSFLKLGTEIMAGLPEWRITLGTFIGVVALPFQIAGLAVVYYGLKPGGKKLSILVFSILAHAIIMGVAFHTSYAFIGSGWKIYNEIGANFITVKLVKRFDFYWRVLIIIIFAEITIGSLVYACIILKRNTLFSKWMFIVNPISVIIFLVPFVYLMPAPVGGFIAPAIFNISTIIFFTITTNNIRKKQKS